MKRFDLFYSVMKEKCTLDMLDVLHGILQDPGITSMEKVSVCTTMIEIILEREKTEPDRSDL